MSTAGDLEHFLDERLDDREDQRLAGKRHLDVDLGELGLPVGPQVLVAEALHDLEVPIHARNHQDLLEDLRRLRQREELALVDAARHQVVARALGRGLGQNRASRSRGTRDGRSARGRPSSPGAAESGCAACRAGADRDSGSGAASLRPPANRRQSRTADAARRSAGESRCATTSTSPVSSFGLMVSALRRSTWPSTATTISVRSFLAAATSPVVVARHDLRHAVAIADVDEGERSEIAHAMNPTEQDRRLADVRRAQCTAGVSATKVSEGVDHRGLQATGLRARNE